MRHWRIPGPGLSGIAGRRSSQIDRPAQRPYDSALSGKRADDVGSAQSVECIPTDNIQGRSRSQVENGTNLPAFDCSGSPSGTVAGQQLARTERQLERPIAPEIVRTV